MRGVKRRTRTNQVRKARPTSETKVQPSMSGCGGSAPVVAELERDSEISFPEEPHHFLELVTRRGGDAKLIALDAGLDLLELVVLEELDDVAGLLGRNALLQRDVLLYSGVPGRSDGAERQITHRHVPPL